MTWQDRPEWFDELPLHRQREWLDWHEMRQQESRRQSRCMVLVCAIGIILIVAGCLRWW